ncbi:MAG: ethylbenzene dehydrogenase-related protein [Planctomycetota bacterium]|jgi:DMSO reductase family type II enzyme heme b subunit
MLADRRILVVVATLAALACGGPGDGPGGPDLPAKELRAARVSGELPAADPFSPSWEQGREVVVPLLLQDVAEPRLTAKGVETLRLSALHDGKRIAFRIEWADGAVDDLVDTDRSTDGVAVQFPANPGESGLPDSMMGEKGKPVAIDFWRASWQRRVEGGETGVAALYPNALIDHYPPEAAKGAENRARLERLYEPPVAVGNPVAAKELASPVESLRSEGFGTLKHFAEQRATGKGLHREGKWHVVIARPLDTAPGTDTLLRPGKSTYIAVAVWDGGENQRGSLKMRSIWVPLELQEAPP